MKFALQTIANILMCLQILFYSNFTHASFHKNLWPQWGVNNPLSTRTISHQLWQHFLNRNLTTNEEQINLIDYAHLKPKDLNLLSEYLSTMSHIQIDNYNRNEQLAYWINLYNALIVQTVATYYPIATIQEINISPGLFSIGPWGAAVIKVKNTPLSLDEINNRIIRPIWNDSRTQYALNKATIGDPNLSKTAYEGANVNKQLNQAAYGYINSLRGVQVIEGKLILSKLYDWYEEDFGGKQMEILSHLLLYAREPLRSQLKNITRIDGYVYNWYLNSTILNSSPLKKT